MIKTLPRRDYPIVQKYPVARFYYKGNHSHPVRRTILIISNDDMHITGYELREGSTERSFAKAPVKSYEKSKIAKYKNCDRKVKRRIPLYSLNKTTFKRCRLIDLVINGI